MIVSKQGSTTTPRQLTRAEREVQTAAERLTVQIEDALVAITGHAPESGEELDACADRLERAARDMAVAIRELAESRGGSMTQ
jgi:hypothetical protein